MMICGQYMYPDFTTRKSFLTTTEEEELIRRLYVCPRLNIFSPRLYEDLPPLKFWNSPASVIECYLQRKVFQKRIQLAYEFNQSKEAHGHILPISSEESSDQLTKAVNQVTEDIYNFTHLTQQSSEIMKIKNNRNKDLWDEIRPEVVFTPPEETLIFSKDEEKLANESKIKFRNHIKKRFSDYKNFYRLQNLARNDKPPLALTIDESPSDNVIKKEMTVSTALSEEYFVDSEEVSEEDSVDCEIVIENTNKLSLPLIKSDTKNNTQNTVNLQHILKNVPRVNDEKDTLLPDFPLYSPHTNSNKGGTVLTLRDSIELAHKRMYDRASRFSLEKGSKDHPLQIPMVTHKDSYTMLSDKLPKIQHESVSESFHSTGSSFESIPHNYVVGGLRGTIIDHQDSVLLALQKISAKQNEDLICDICSEQEYKSIRFLCDFHASELSSKCQIPENKSRLSRITDSVVIAKSKTSVKNSRKSIGCQVNKISIQTETVPLKDTVAKGSKKIKNNDDSIKTETIKLPPAKLKNFLMKAVQIEQVKTYKDSSPRI